MLRKNSDTIINIQIVYNRNDKERTLKVYLEQSDIAEDIYKRILLERKVEEQLGKYSEWHLTFFNFGFISFVNLTLLYKILHTKFLNNIFSSLFAFSQLVLKVFHSGKSFI